MKTFFQFAEQAKQHRRKKALNELVAGQPQQTATPAVATPTQPAAPDYKTFGLNWDKFATDNAAAIAALSKAVPALGTMKQTIQKMMQPAQPAAPAAGTPVVAPGTPAPAVK